MHGIDVHQLVGEERWIYDYIFNYVCVWVQLILLKTENNKKIIFLTIYYCSTLFMANEQCITRWTYKKKYPKREHSGTTQMDLIYETREELQKSNDQLV